MKRMKWLPVSAGILALAFSCQAAAEEYRGFDDIGAGDWNYEETGYDAGYEDYGYNGGYEDAGAWTGYDDGASYDDGAFQDVISYGNSDYRGFDDVGSDGTMSGYGYDDYLTGDGSGSYSGSDSSYSGTDSGSYSSGSYTGSSTTDSGSYTGSSTSGSGSYTGSSTSGSASTSETGRGSQTQTEAAASQTNAQTAAGTEKTAADAETKETSKAGETTTVNTMTAAAPAADPADDSTCRFTTDSIGQIEIHYCEKHAPLIEREERQAEDGLSVEELKSLINSWESSLNELYIKWQSPLSVQAAGKVRNARIAFYTQLDQQDLVLTPLGEETALRFRLQALKEECARLCLQLRNRG